MSVVDIRPARDCRFDVLTLGEVMLRLDPGEGRVRTARTFQVSEGGGEYNVGRALRRCFGQRAALVTAIGDNEVGRLLALAEERLVGHHQAELDARGRHGRRHVRHRPPARLGAVLCRHGPSKTCCSKAVSTWITSCGNRLTMSDVNTGRR